VSILTIFAKRFITGETLDSAIAAVRKLNANKMTATLDILGENVRNQQMAIKTADSYIEMLEAIARTGIDSNISLKLTQMGLDISDEFCYSNVNRILDKATELKNFVRVDMEGSAYTERTLRLVYMWHDKYPNVGTVIQAYLHRSQKDINELNRRKITVRLCKGAYKEPKEVAFQSKLEVNANYIKLTDLLMKDGTYPAIATHDRKMIESALVSARKYNRKNDDYEFQMLYGINRSGQRELKEQGYRMRIYTPFGEYWFPYYFRRLRERKENVFFIFRHMFD
jgi:proline dehydrogenase